MEIVARRSQGRRERRSVTDWLSAVLYAEEFVPRHFALVLVCGAVACGSSSKSGGDGPRVVQSFQDSQGRSNGACTYAEGASAAGVMGLTAAISRTPVFQIYASGVSVP